MRPNFERMSFANAYYLANEVRAVVVEWPGNDYTDVEEFIDFADQKVLELLAKPQRWSLLHVFIQAFYEHDLCEFEVSTHHYLDMIVDEYQMILEEHGISMPSIDIPDEDEIDDEDPDGYTTYKQQMQHAIKALRSELPTEAIVNSAFQLLYGDRPFLHTFNTVVAEHVSEMTVEDYPDILDHDGVLTRARRLPEWLKHGVFHRDRGRCALCHKDMTGIIATSEERHYDHIIPRALGGCNDPTNFQLLCRDCNLRKGGTQRDVSRLVPVYWALD